MMGIKAFGSGIKNENMFNEELADELDRSFIRKFWKRKVYSFFIDNLWGADLADMQPRCKFNIGFRFYYVLLIFSENMNGLP